MHVPVFLLLLLATAWPSLAQPAGAGQKIQLEKHFHTFSGQRLELNLATPAAIALTGWDREEVVVKVNLEGKYLEVTCQQLDSVVYVVSRFTQAASSAFARGTIEITLPYQLEVRARVPGGDITLRDLRSRLVLEHGEGTVTGHNLQGLVQLSTRNGQVALYGGHVQGDISAQQGSVTIADVRGKFRVTGNAGHFSVNSFTEPVVGQMQSSLITLTLSEGDLEARAYKSEMNVTWKGHRDSKQQKLSVSGDESKITLAVPEALGMDAVLDQVSTDKKDKTAASPVSAMESDFDLGATPAAKKFTRAGKTHQLVQVRRKINNGGNQLEIMASDSQVKLKKIK